MAALVATTNGRWGTGAGMASLPTISDGVTVSSGVTVLMPISTSALCSTIVFQGTGSAKGRLAIPPSASFLAVLRVKVGSCSIPIVGISYVEATTGSTEKPRGGGTIGT